MTTPVVLTLRFEKTAHLTIQAELNGLPARFIVDTGASASCIDLAALASYGLRLNQVKHQGGGVGSASMQVTAIRRTSLILNGLDCSALRLYALDLSHVNLGLQAAKVEAVVGIIGADLLRKYQALIDYQRKILLLQQPV